MNVNEQRGQAALQGERFIPGMAFRIRRGSAAPTLTLSEAV
jgi:hypothetical protein